MATSLRVFLRELRQNLLRRAGLLGARWEEALPEELSFWQKALSDPDRHWLRSDYDLRMNPVLPLQEEFRNLIDAPPGVTVRLLDVGAGPLTRLGKIWEGRTIEITPVDPLADQYRGLFEQLRLTPPVVTVPGRGEELLAQFGPDRFDLAYASNALDHSYDPLKAIREMVAVVKPGCSAYLWHFAAVGQMEGYTGLHQWNFDIVNGDMVLTDGKGTRLSLATEFQGSADLTCEFQTFSGAKVVVGKLRKRPADSHGQERQRP